jgi:hypothetical protein
VNRTLLPPFAGWTIVLGGALLTIAGSLSYLGGNVYALIATSASGAAAGGPDFVAGVEALPSGSISAIVPLPAQDQPSSPVAAASTAAVPAAVDTVPPETPASAAPALEVAATGGTRMVATISVNVRDRPSNDSRVIGTLRDGASVAVLGSQQGWMQIADGTGQSGWVYGRYLRPANQAPGNSPEIR